MSTITIWYFIKLFEKESYADQFIKGKLYLSNLAHFKQAEGEDGAGRVDATEGVAKWFQPSDIVMKINVPKIGVDIEIMTEDLAAPVSISFNYHDQLRLLCLYAVYSSGFTRVNGKFHCEPNEAEELQRQFKIDERYLKLGKFAVIVSAVPLLHQVRETLTKEGYKAVARLVNYYRGGNIQRRNSGERYPFPEAEAFQLSEGISDLRGYGHGKSQTHRVKHR